MAPHGGRTVSVVETSQTGGCSFAVAGIVEVPAGGKASRCGSGTGNSGSDGTEVAALV